MNNIPTCIYGLLFYYVRKNFFILKICISWVNYGFDSTIWCLELFYYWIKG